MFLTFEIPGVGGIRIVRVHGMGDLLMHTRQLGCGEDAVTIGIIWVVVFNTCSVCTICGRDRW